MSELIDTTEMYLRTIFELTEEGVRPMRARIAERLGQSGPTVSQTVARMQRDGLVELAADDRHLVLTTEGLALATRVMRKHRLAECLLVDLIGLPWEEVHTEACRWEHVMSEAVERRLVELLDHPTMSPFGWTIPGLAELESDGDPAAAGSSPTQLPAGGLPAAEAATAVEQHLRVLRIGELLQSDEEILARLREVGAVPGGRVAVVAQGSSVRMGSATEQMLLDAGQAVQVIVSAG